MSAALPLERMVRGRDADTSWEAAESISPEGWSDLMHRVYDIVYDAHQPVTQEQIVALYESKRKAQVKRMSEDRDMVPWPRVAPQRIRTAVSSMVRGSRVDFGNSRVCTRALRIVDMEGRTVAGGRARRYEVSA